MKTPKFSKFLSDTISGCLFSDDSINLGHLSGLGYSFEPLTVNASAPVGIDANLDMKSDYLRRDVSARASLINTLKLDPNEELIMNNDFSFVISFDGCIARDNISLKNLLKVSKKLHTDSIFVTGDGNDYSVGDYESGHDAKVILNVEFYGSKEKLIADYHEWFAKELAISKVVADKKNTNKR